MLARRICDEIGNVVDQGLLNVTSVLSAEERGRSSGLHSVWPDGRNEFTLQPMQVCGRFDHDARKAKRRVWDVVILERFQRPLRGLLFGHDRIRRRKYLVEVVRAD